MTDVLERDDTAIRLAAAQIALSDNPDYNVRKAIRVLEQTPLPMQLE